MYRLEDFDYTLPEGHIATQPTQPRDHSRLMRLTPPEYGITDHHFYDLPRLLAPDSLLVLNNAKVIPARLMGKRRSGASIEVLLTKELSPGLWSAKIKKVAKLKIDEILEFGAGKLSAQYKGRHAEGEGTLEFADPNTLINSLEQYGHPPLPPYILKARLAQDPQAFDDKTSYQTLFAEKYGAVAAPTAGLHMTSAVFEQIQNQGIELAYVTLNVGLGTFEPIRTSDFSQHKMHQETYEITSVAAQQINEAKRQGRNIVALGTTSLRVLESAVRQGQVLAGKGESSLFIYPPYQFQIVDQLVTNFHLPKSTLLMLVSAFMGRDVTLSAYQNAITKGYRFFSYGDAMLLG